jgi:Fe2+ or Zn2+ uptake regulation protein
MKAIQLTETQKLVLKAIKQEPLTSYQILKKVEKISLILSLYNVMDDLRVKGAIKTYVKENVKYHYAA